jgi:hypothetical protein
MITAFFQGLIWMTIGGLSHLQGLEVEDVCEAKGGKACQAG